MEGSEPAPAGDNAASSASLDGFTWSNLDR
jgi:hypothetical protein